jgi:hypothetical protein
MTTLALTDDSPSAPIHHKYYAGIDIGYKRHTAAAIPIEALGGRRRDAWKHAAASATVSRPGRPVTRWQTAERVQPKVLQERGGGDEKARPAAPAKAGVLGDQSARSKCLDHRVAVHHADAADVGAGDGLLVGDDRQGVQRRLG